METEGALNAALLWLTKKMRDNPWITWAIGFCGGMLIGFLIWAIGAK